VEEVLTGRRDEGLGQKLRDTYTLYCSGRGRGRGTGSFDLHTEGRAVMRGSRARAAAATTIPQALHKTRALIIMCIAHARTRLRVHARMHLHAWHAAAVVSDLKVAAHTAFGRRLLRVRVLLQALRCWRSRAAKKASVKGGCVHRSMVRMNYRRTLAAARSCLWRWRVVVPLSKRVTSQVHSPLLHYPPPPPPLQHGGAGAEHDVVPQHTAARLGAQLRHRCCSTPAPCPLPVAAATIK